MQKKSKSDNLHEHVMRKLEIIDREIKEIRQKDIPSIKTDVAVVKSEAASSAKIISSIGGIIAVATSLAIAFVR